jgi:hypothetical protein
MDAYLAARGRVQQLETLKRSIEAELEGAKRQAKALDVRDVLSRGGWERLGATYDGVYNVACSNDVHPVTYVWLSLFSALKFGLAGQKFVDCGICRGISGALYNMANECAHYMPIVREMDDSQDTDMLPEARRVWLCCLRIWVRLAAWLGRVRLRQRVNPPGLGTRLAAVKLVQNSKFF